MKWGAAFVGIFLLLASVAHSGQENGGDRLAAASSCTLEAPLLPILPEMVKKEDLPSATLLQTPQTSAKGSYHIKLEANDDLASVTLAGGAIYPYVGASINLLPLPKYDPETSSSQVLAYGLGAGFGCDLGGYTRLSLRYQIRFFSETGAFLNRMYEEEEIHRISLGLQTSF